MALTKLNARSATALDATILTGNLPAISGASLTGLSAGITEADQWRVTSSFANSSNGVAEVITSNWERADEHFDKIGTGLSQSSGVFSFPSTGIYWITIHGFFYPTGANSDIRIQLRQTPDDGSNYYTRAEGMNGASGADRPETISCSCILDVTDTSNYKFTIRTIGTTASNFWRGDTGAQKFGLTCIRLGDT